MLPDDLRTAIAVNQDGLLGMITTPTGVLGITPTGQRWASTERKPIVLGRFADWFHSGRKFHVWLKDKGYHSHVPDTASHVFLAHAQALGVL
jgi:hypothetical protein